MSNTQSPTPESEEGSLKDWAYKALTCLYIELDESSANDVNQRVKAYFAQLERQRDEARQKLETAEQQVDAQSNLVCNIQDTCRSRGFNQRPVDEAVIAMAQQSDRITTLLAQIAVKDEALKIAYSYCRNEVTQQHGDLIDKAISPTASNELVERLTLLKQQVETLEHSSEDNFVQNLFSRLHELGIDTSDCDGEDAPYRILADWIATRMKDEYVKQRKS